jgi:putative glutamine amidotransferase
VKPIIGVTTYAEQARWGVWDVASALVPMSYVTAVRRAGGRPVLLPPDDEAIDETLDAVDGLLFSGGSDIDPSLYGAEPHPSVDGTRPDRDRAELALMQAALERELPILAVCRGMEVMNVARGGDIVQHLPDVVGHEDHKHTPGVFGDHEVDLEPRSRLGTILGERAPVKSHHHQGVGRLGEGLVESAWAEDGTIEGIEDPSRPFALGVLWHPEQGEDFALFQTLVEEARRYRDSRR